VDVEVPETKAAAISRQTLIDARQEVGSVWIGSDRRVQNAEWRIGQGGMENADAAHPSDRYYRYSVCLSICLCVLEKLQIGRAAVVLLLLCMRV